MNRLSDFPQENRLRFVRTIADTLAQQVATVLPEDVSPRILVALSGGPDSTALLLALHHTVPDALVGAAHFHHGLRGADANEDAAFCAGLCTRLGTPCAIGLGKVVSAGLSPQDAARRDRYTFLIETATELGANLIAIAHNADDQAETVLGRVLRGTSVDGLAGIAETREVSDSLFIIRPMLHRTRAEVEAFCASENITPRQDPTNAGTKYMRSRLRQRMPEIARDFNPRLGDSLRRLATNAAVDGDLLTMLANDLWSQTIRELQPGIAVSLDRSPLATAHPALRRRVLLRALVTAYISESTGTALEEAATFAFVQDLERIVLTGKGAVSLPGGKLRAIATDSLLSVSGTPVSPILPQPFLAPLPIPGKASIEEIGLTVSTEQNVSATDTPTNLLTVRFDRAAIPEAGLLLRSPRPGDRIAPFGMGGKTKSVRDVCANAHIPVEERNRIPLVTRADEPATILWIVGRMQSEQTRITTATQEIVTLTANWAVK